MPKCTYSKVVSSVDKGFSGLVRTIFVRLSLFVATWPEIYLVFIPLQNRSKGALLDCHPNGGNIVCYAKAFL